MFISASEDHAATIFSRPPDVEWYFPPEGYSPTRLCGVIMYKDTISVLFELKEEMHGSGEELC
jgi:hypothetical protein